MKKLILPLAILVSSAVQAQDAPSLPPPASCKEFSASIQNRAVDAFLLYEAARNKIQVRIAIDDGIVKPAPMAYQPNRINLEVRSGKVIRAYCG